MDQAFRDNRPPTSRDTSNRARTLIPTYTSTQNDSYGSHTFKNVNEEGQAVYVKYHFKTDQARDDKL